MYQIPPQALGVRGTRHTALSPRGKPTMKQGMVLWCVNAAQGGSVTEGTTAGADLPGLFP